MDSQDIRISKQFCKFCIKVLKNEACNIYTEEARKAKREKSISELKKDELIKLSSFDRYFEDEHIFNVLDNEIIVMGNTLAGAIEKLPKQKQDIILLSYFAGLTDREIGEKLGAIQQTISYRRISSLKQLKTYLTKENFE